MKQIEHARDKNCFEKEMPLNSIAFLLRNTIFFSYLISVFFFFFQKRILMVHLDLIIIHYAEFQLWRSSSFSVKCITKM